MLDPLIEAIETVKERIEQHRQTLSESETRTRGALINPILKALGWDPGDPALVTLEYKVAELFADYALHGANAEEKPAAVIEAKKLDEPLGKHRRQMLTYANEQGIEYAGLTDGNKWELYSVFERSELIDRRFVNVSIAEDEPHTCALELLSLWRLNLASGKVKKVNVPVIVKKEETNSPEYPEPTPDPPIEPPLDGNWVSLSECRPQKKGAPRPSAIRLPDKSERSIASWTDVLMKTAEWLCEKNHLTDDNLPVHVSPRSKKYIVSASNVQGTGKEMRRPGIINNGRYYVEKNLVPTDLCKNARTLLEHCGQDPSKVYLKRQTLMRGNDG